MASHLNSVFGAPQAILNKPSVSQLPLAFWLCSSGMTHRYFFSYNLVSRGGKRGCLDWQGTAVHPRRDPPVLGWASMQTGMVVAFLQSTELLDHKGSE